MVDNIEDRPSSAWHPMTDPWDLAVLGKLAEEASELAQIAARCMIQGVNEVEPETKVLNKDALAKEMADVFACMRRAMAMYSIPDTVVSKRYKAKLAYLIEWDRMLGNEMTAPAFED